MIVTESPRNTPATANPLISADDAVRAARGLSDVIKSRVLRTEDERRVPDETINEMIEAGLFGVVTPKVFGGAELGFSTLVSTTIEIASVCGSSGWVYGVLAGHSWLLNLFPIQAQKEILPDPRALIATVFRLGGTVTEVEGGYRLVGGEGRFCSGIDHASWVIVGNAVIRPGQPPEPRFFVIPRKDIEVVDDWFTAGLRGTGSKTIRVADTFIPAHRSVRVEEMTSGASEGAAFHSGPLYQMPFSDIAPFSIVGVALGLARGALQMFGDTMTAKLATGTELDVAEASIALSRMAAASSAVDAAVALVLADARLIEGAGSPADISEMERARIPRDWAYAVQTSRRAVNDVFELAGGSGIYNNSAMQRVWRDANSAAQHFAFGWDNAMSNYGRAMVGKAPIAYQLKRR